MHLVGDAATEVHFHGVSVGFVASTAQFERELISENIAGLKAGGVTKYGRRVRFGRLPMGWLRVSSAGAYRLHGCRSVAASGLTTDPLWPWLHFQRKTNFGCSTNRRPQIEISV